MVKYRCGICRREFSTTSGLTRHANAMHQGRTTLSRVTEPRHQQSIHQQSRRTLIPEHDENLWSTPITNTSVIIAPINTNFPRVDVDDVDVEDVDVEDINVEDVDVEDVDIDVDNEPRYNLRSQVQDDTMESDDVEEREEENDDESDEELQSPLNIGGIDFDSEDLQGATLDDALDTIKGKNKPEHVAE